MNFKALHLDELIRHHVNPKQEICSKMQVEAIAKELDVTPLQLLLILTTAALNIEAFIERLQEENRLLKIKLSLLEKKSNHRVTQQEVLKAGKKLAYKPQASIENIRRLEEKGYTDEQIAAYLGVSRSTVWRRRKEGAYLPNKPTSNSGTLPF